MDRVDAAAGGSQEEEEGRQPLVFLFAAGRGEELGPVLANFLACLGPEGRPAGRCVPRPGVCLFDSYVALPPLQVG